MFKRMVTMRKALHKREEDTTPRGVEADELVEGWGGNAARRKERDGPAIRLLKGRDATNSSTDGASRT